jgi:hypothetical protein
MEQASEEIRYGAHIRVRDYEKWKAQLKEFYEANKSAFAHRPDFLKGYLFHCYSDIAWDEAVQPKLFEFLYTLGYGYDDMTYQKWQELYRFNGAITAKKEYREICDTLLTAKAEQIGVCSAELIGKYRDYVAKDYSDKIIYEAPLFLTEKHIDDTVERVRELLK